MSKRLAVWMMAAALAVPGIAGAEGDEGGCAKACCQHADVVKKRIVAGGRGCEGGGYMGVSLQEVDAEELGKLALKEQGAARIKRVSPGSPAAKAGFKEGDVVVRFDGMPVSSARQLACVVGETAAGREVKVDVRRGSESLALRVTVAEKECRPEIHRELADDLPQLDHLLQITKDFRELLIEPAGARRLGIRYQEVSGQLARYFRLEGEHGLLVTHVDEGSPAEKGGLKAGDVILGVDGKDVRDGGDLRRRVASHEDGELRIRVQRDGKPVDVSVMLRTRPAPNRYESTT